MDNQIITDNPEGRYESSLNCFFVRDHEVFVRGAGPAGIDVSLAAFMAQIVRENELEHLVFIDDTMSTDDVSEIMADMLSYGTSDLAGVLAYLYLAAWVAAELREQLKAREDLDNREASADV